MRGYGYSWPGAYFVTICSRNREAVFGTLTDSEMEKSPLGEMVWRRWTDIPNHHPGASLDAAVLMPDHLHAIVLLEGELIAPWSVKRDPDAERHRSPDISTVIGSFKSACSKEAGRTLWQRGYYDRIIRSEAELIQIRKYIEENEVLWRARQASPLQVPRNL